MSTLLRFLTKSRADAARLRRDQAVDGGMTYSALGQGRVVQGDESFPFFKDPADNDVPQLYLPEQTLVDASANITLYVDAPALDVRGLRGVQLYLTVERIVADPVSLTGALSVLPEAAVRAPVDDEPTWYPIGVIDTTLTTDGTPRESYARRNLFATELVFDPSAEISPAPVVASGVWRYAVPFDVAQWDFVRFRFGGRDDSVIATAFVAGHR
jgi:hypothetical protein